MPKQRLWSPIENTTNAVKDTPPSFWEKCCSLSKTEIKKKLWPSNLAHVLSYILLEII